MPLMELNVEAAWAAYQSAQGAPATAPAAAGSGFRYRKVAGGLGVTPEDGSENYSDGQRLSSAAAFRQTIGGGGAPGLQMQPGMMGHLAKMWCGGETTSGTATNAVQTATVTGTPTGGTATLTFSGQSTSALAFNANAATVQAALEALSNIGKGNVQCGGGPWPGTAITITFISQMAASPHVLITATHAFTGGTTPNIAVVSTVTGVAVEHVATPSSTSLWSTWFKTLGSSVVQRQKFNDVRCSGLQMQSGRDQFVGRVTPTLISLDPGEVIAADPTLGEEVDDSVLWTEADGELTINGAVITGTTGYNIQTTDGLTPAYGSGVKAFDVGTGVGAVTGSDIVLYLNTAGLARYNEIVYGSSSPAPGSKPIGRVPAIGSFKVRHWRFNTSVAPGRLVEIDCPNVQWTTPDAPEGNPDGGLATVSLGFTTVKRGADPHIRITTRSSSPAFAL